MENETSNPESLVKKTEEVKLYRIVEVLQCGNPTGMCQGDGDAGNYLRSQGFVGVKAITAKRDGQTGLVVDLYKATAPRFDRVNLLRITLSGSAKNAILEVHRRTPDGVKVDEFERGYILFPPNGPAEKPTFKVEGMDNYRDWHLVCEPLVENKIPEIEIDPNSRAQPKTFTKDDISLVVGDLQAASESFALISEESWKKYHEARAGRGKSSAKQIESIERSLAVIRKVRLALDVVRERQFSLRRELYAANPGIKPADDNKADSGA